MKYLLLLLMFAIGFVAAQFTDFSTAADSPPVTPPKVVSKSAPANPNIDMAGYLKVAQEAAGHRESHRLSEEAFLKMSQEEGVIVLDARSKEMYDLLHVSGAVNLSFPNIDVESLKKVLPDKNAKILIYCNNNFTPATGARPNAAGNPVAAKAAAAFAPKAPRASLNLSTYISLYSYGYKNVYELAPLINPAKTKLALVSTKK